MAHSSETRWQEASGSIAGVAAQTLAALLNAEEVYQELLEVYQYSGSSDQLMADLLFKNAWSVRESDPEGAPGVFDTQANADEVAKVADLKGAITALHELYGALTNQVTATEDRATALRRMS